MSRPAFRPVTVLDVVTETPDACSIVLDEELDYRPGQFLTFRVPHEQLGSVSRCYSLSSSPQTDDHPVVTVKRVPGGHASNWICDNIRAGSTVELHGPAGTFTPGTLDEDLLLFAAGSGITPVMSIIRAVLFEGTGNLCLVYANRDHESVIFDAELAELVRLQPLRLRVEHWLDADRGYPTTETLTPLVADFAGRHAFVCGPEPFMAVAEKALAGLGTPAEKVHIERFTVDDEQTVGTGRVTAVEVDLDGTVHRLDWPDTKRLLDVFIDAGLNPPYSCRQGNCGACMLRMLEGEVELANNEILEEEDFAENWTLACQAMPRCERARFTYDAP